MTQKTRIHEAKLAEKTGLQPVAGKPGVYENDQHQVTLEPNLQGVNVKVADKKHHTLKEKFIKFNEMHEHDYVLVEEIIDMLSNMGF